MVTELQGYTGITVSVQIGFAGTLSWKSILTSNSFFAAHVWILSISLAITVLHNLVFKIYLFHFWLCFVWISRVFFVFVFNVLMFD